MNCTEHTSRETWATSLTWENTGEDLNFVNVFLLFRNYHNLEKGGYLHLNKFEFPFTKGCFEPSLVEIGPVVLEMKILLKFVNVFLLFHNYIHLEKGAALFLNKLGFRSPKDALCKVWLKLAKWFWRRRFVNVFSLFRNYLSWKRAWPFIWTNLNPLYLRMHCAKFGWIGSVVLEKKMKMWNVYRQTDGQQAIRKAHLNF